MSRVVHYNLPPPGTGIRCTTSDNYDHILYPHYHTDYELSIAISGIHRLILDNETVRLRPGSLFLLRPNETHTRVMETPGKHITVAFPATEFYAAVRFLGDGMPVSALWSDRMPTVMLSATEVEEYIRRKERLNLFCVSNPARALAELRAMLVDLLFYYLANPYSSSSARTPWLAKLLQEMEKPENIRRGLPAMLEITPYSHEYLCREFKRMMGCTPTEFINNARLDLAHKMLENPKLGIVDICYAAGFESVSYFYTLFKAKFGNTPSRYRKNRFISHPSVPPEQFKALAE